MFQRLRSITAWLDAATESATRHTAQSMGRRHVLTRLGTYMVAGTMVPMLPFDRSGGAAFAFGAEGKDAQDTDDTACDYWRYCALGGRLCTTCNGSVSECTPGTEASVVTWVGTCENPADGRHYLISYQDCCGGGGCGGEVTSCSNNIRERPGYRMGLHNGINWCMANDAQTYHCTVALIVGVEET